MQQLEETVAMVNTLRGVKKKKSFVCGTCDIIASINVLVRNNKRRANIHKRTHNFLEEQNKIHAHTHTVREHRLAECGVCSMQRAGTIRDDILTICCVFTDHQRRTALLDWRQQMKCCQRGCTLPCHPCHWCHFVRLVRVGPSEGFTLSSPFI